MAENDQDRTAKGPNKVNSQSDDPNELGPMVTVAPRETRKRKREILLAVVITTLFLILSWVGFRLIENSQNLPFEYSLFFIGLVNFNIALLLLLLFLIFRNIVKIFVERQGRGVSGTLKGKLVAAFAAFSIIPTALMFIISVFYINSSFDKWFSEKIRGVLMDAQEITQDFYRTTKARNYHFAREIAADISRGGSPAKLTANLSQLRRNFSLDSVELYPGLFEPRIVALNQDENIPEIPKVSLEFLKKGVQDRSDASTIHTFAEGNLLRVIAPLVLNTRQGPVQSAIVVSSYIPLSTINKQNEIAATYEDLKPRSTLIIPFKSFYLVMLVIMTLVILFGATWFGFHLARQLTTPLESLAEAARRISRGKYGSVDIVSGSREINQLVGSFNQMTSALKSTLDTLDEHNRYIEVVLSNISAGVISLDSHGRITTINRRAGRLLRIVPENYIGSPARDHLKGEHLQMFDSIIETLRKHRAQSIQKEIRLDVGGESLVMQMTLSLLKEEQGRDLGIVFVFDDLTILVNAQRASAWREVARRIAHEIKNPLTPIKLSAQRLEKKFGSEIKDPAFQSCTSTIIKQVDELRDMVNEFSNFARLPQAKPEASQLNQAIEEALVLYQTGHKDVDFRFQPDQDLPIFDFDLEQMKRVVANLVSNAIQSFQETNTENGNVEISTHYDSLLGIARIIVRDNGPGIPEDVRSRIFEPYFSTKRSGTGLGLAIVKRIIDDHNGFIRAFANEGRGTKFVIELPLLKAHPSRTAEVSAVVKGEAAHIVSPEVANEGLTEVSPSLDLGLQTKMENLNDE